MQQFYLSSVCYALNTIQSTIFLKNKDIRKILNYLSLPVGDIWNIKFNFLCIRCWCITGVRHGNRMRWVEFFKQRCRWRVLHVRCGEGERKEEAMTEENDQVIAEVCGALGGFGWNDWENCMDDGEEEMNWWCGCVVYMSCWGNGVVDRYWCCYGDG